MPDPLDQTPMPINIKVEMRAPDFVALVRHNNRVVPLLIEVKKSDQEKWHGLKHILLR